MRVSNGNSSSEKPVSNAALAWLFFFSGFIALVYEALWQRRFSLVFGSAAPATAAVLAAYFAGLAIGAFAIGKRVHRFESPLRLYAALECIIALGALLVEAWLYLFDHFQPTINSPTLLLLTKIILAFIALAIPTICMGGTLPALGAYIDRGEHHLGRTAGLLYVVNTAGAAVGVLAFPLLLLPNLGARTSLIFCVFINILISAFAYRLAGRARRSARAASKPTIPTNPPRPEKTKPEPTCPPPLFLAFLSGLTAFIIQIQWNRAFAQIHENSLLSFALIAAIFIAALAVGGQITRLALRRNTQPTSLLKFAWLIAGLLIIASPWIFLSATNNLSYISATNSWLHYALKLSTLSLLLIFPIATLIGIALPAIFEHAGRHSNNPGKILGQLLTSNLIGSAIGALLAGFVFPKFFTLWTATIYSGALFLAMSANFFPKIKIAFLLLILPLIIAVSRIDLPRVRLNPDRNEKLLAISEGPHGIVSVIERADSRRLKLNNAYVLGGTASTGDERMQSHIPLLLHPNPQRVAYMGLGTGISAGGAAFHPVQQITILELVPEVAQAARAHFADANMRILDKPNTRLIVEDARNYLRHTHEKFDVIIGDLVVPWKAGEGALFTQENFQAGKNALNPGGLFCQWLPMFQLSEDEFRILLNTFLSVFPETFLWRADFSPNETALALIGFADDKTFTAKTIHRRLAQMNSLKQTDASTPTPPDGHRSPSPIGEGQRFSSPSPPVGEGRGRGEGAVSPSADPANPHLISDYAIWMNFIGSVTRADVNPNWRINSEDRPWVELLGPIAHARQNSAFVGRPLQNWTRELNAISMTRFHATEVEAAAIHAGDLLFEFTLSLSENNQPAATAAQSDLKQLLPPPLYATIFPQ